MTYRHAKTHPVGARAITYFPTVQDGSAPAASFNKWHGIRGRIVAPKSSTLYIHFVPDDSSVHERLGTHPTHPLVFAPINVKVVGGGVFLDWARRFK